MYEMETVPIDLPIRQQLTLLQKLPNILDSSIKWDDFESIGALERAVHHQGFL